jgi:Calcineurin-like phosphoesterase
MRYKRLRIYTVVAVTIFAAVSFQSCKTRDHNRSKALNSDVSDKYDLLVIGDIQRKLNVESKFQAKGGTGELSILIDEVKNLAPDFKVLGNRSTDTNPSDKMRTLALKELIRENGVSAVVQTGDMVDWNNGLVFRTESADFKSEADEWDILDWFPKEIPIYSTAGNHESFKELIINAKIDSVEKSKLNFIFQPEVKFRSPMERKQLLLEKYKTLKPSDFFGDNASYFVDNEKYILVSIDSNSFGVPSLASPPAEAKLQEESKRNEFENLKKVFERIRSESPNKLLIVVCHFPFFSSTQTSSGFDATYRDQLIKLFDDSNVTLVFNGHEHLYLRYANEWRKNVGYEKDIGVKTIFATVGAFANDYAEKEKKDIIKNTPRFDLKGDNQAGSQTIDRLVYLDRSHHVLLKIVDRLVKVKVFGLNLKATNPSERWIVQDSYEAKIR